MPQPSQATALPRGVDIPASDWQQTPASVQTVVQTFVQRVEALEARLQQDSTTSHRPPSTDAPYQPKPKTPEAGTRRKAGGQPGHPGHRQPLLPPTALHMITPPPCPCGYPQWAALQPYYTHQVIELPPIQLDVTHCVLEQGQCPHCQQWSKAVLPPEHATGYGPRLTALVGESAGTHGTSRRTLQTFGASVLQLPLSLGAIQPMIARVTQAITPHYEAIAQHARQATVNYSDETPWYFRHALHGLWVMASETVACYRMHPHRSTEAFTALIDAWQGLLVSDGYGVYQAWVSQRHTGLAHLIRTARGLAARGDPGLAACGAWALAELQRLCHLATALPTGGEWRAWYARLCHLIARYHDSQDDAGRFARRLLRERNSLWVLLAQHGVEPTNNRAERA